MWAVIRVTGNCEGSSSYKCFNRIKDAASDFDTLIWPHFGLLIWPHPNP